MTWRRAAQLAKLSACLMLSLALPLAGSELYLRSYVFDPGSWYVLTPGWEIVFRPSIAGTPGIAREARTRINRLGLRGDLPDRSSQPRYLAIGGSTTEDIMLDFSESWAGHLQTHLRRCSPNAWVGNAGKSGTNARHHAMQLEKILPRLPRLDVVVMLSGLNDMLFDF